MVRIRFPPAESHQRTIARGDRHRSPPSLVTESSISCSRRLSMRHQHGNRHMLEQFAADAADQGFAQR